MGIAGSTAVRLLSCLCEAPVTPRKRFQGTSEADLPANFCGRCREWVTSNEKTNLFSVVDNTPQVVPLWVCPDCKACEQGEK